MLNWDVWNAWKWRVFLIGGLVVITMNLMGEGILEFDAPPWLNVYLLISGFYFATNPQARVATRWQQRLVHVLFPGAFVTTLLPVYTLLLFIARRGWF